MSGDGGAPQGPDFRVGIPSGDLAEGTSLVGRVDDDAVLVIRVHGDVFAVAATCTHWGGPLAEGIVVGETVRCPWHHACFSIKTGAVYGGPALDGLSRWAVEERDGTVRVTGRLEGETAAPSISSSAPVPERVVIVGAGGAGTVAAAELRRLGYDKQVIVVDPDPDASVDRPNLSKDFLAGNAPEEWIPLRPAEWWVAHDIERRQAEVHRLDVSRHEITLENGDLVPYGALILATGAAPVRVHVPGDGVPIYTLRTLADARRIIQAADDGARVAVLGASFIGLEVAASLRAREIEVHVVAPEATPLERIMGREAGEFVKQMHEEHGVEFHLRRTAARRTTDGLVLSDGTAVAADFVVAGVGVRPRVDLAERAGLDVQNGVIVDDRLRTAAPEVFAVGDIARYPDPRSGERVRIEHWAVAQRQGRSAARNAVGMDEAFSDAPFFWSQHYDIPIAYVGHAPSWDALEVDGSFEDHDVAVRYLRKGKVLAMASVFRDVTSLEFEAQLEQRGG